MQRIVIGSTALLPVISVGLSGVMLGMALEAWLRDTGRRWLRWTGHALAWAVQSAARAATGIARKRRRGTRPGRQ